MTGKTEPRLPEPAVLPGLEQLLVRAARRGAAPRRRIRRRWFLIAAAAALVLAAGAAAATGLLPIAEGDTDRGTYTVEPVSISGLAGIDPSAGQVCLQLRLEDRGPSYGCGDAPTSSQPFGLLVADPLAEGSDERVVYGLVKDEIARISVLGEEGERTESATDPQAGLPGRFFAVVVPHLGRIEIVGYDETGRERARIGSRARPSHPPRVSSGGTGPGGPGRIRADGPAHEHLPLSRDDHHGSRSYADAARVPAGTNAVSLLRLGFRSRVEPTNPVWRIIRVEAAVRGAGLAAKSCLSCAMGAEITPSLSRQAIGLIELG